MRRPKSFVLDPLFYVVVEVVAGLAAVAELLLVVQPLQLARGHNESLATLNLTIKSSQSRPQ